MKQFTAPRLELITPDVVKRPLFASFVISLVVILTAGVYYIFAQPVLPIFYTLARPAQTLASKEWLFVFPSISFAMSVAHVLIVHWLRTLEPILLVLFARTGLVLQIILLAALLRIVFITL
jgi:hypothetical protein